MAGLTRKKVKVRSKSGKVYQRSVMVKSGAKPAGRKLNNLFPTGPKMKTGDYLRQHGAFLNKAHFGIGTAQGAAMHIGANHFKGHGDHRTRAAIGTAAVGLVGSGGLMLSRKGKAAQKDFNRLGYGQRLAVNGLSLVSNIAGHAVGFGASHLGHKVVRNYNRGARFEQADQRTRSR